MDNEKPAKKIKEKKPRREKNKKLRAGIVVFVIGMATLVAGTVVMLINLLSVPGIRDAEFLVQVGSFARQDAPGVIWNFTEIGKGTLTTNNHENDYDFIWAIEGEKLKIETDWLYELNNEFDYKIDKEKNTLTLIGGEYSADINFSAASSVDTEAGQDN